MMGHDDGASFPRLESLKLRPRLHCTRTEGVTVHLRLHCSGAEVVPDSLTVYTVPVAFVNQIVVLLLRIVKEQNTYHMS